MLKVTYRADGSALYTTMQDDMVDRIARGFYGTHAGTTELVYAANPGLAEVPLVLPPGLTVVLPAAAIEKPAAPTINLWN